MAHHILKATRDTVHLGGFSNLLKPVLTINSGDTIDVETYTGYYVYDQAPPEFLTPEFVDICQNLASERKVAPGPHLLTGPIYVRGAEPGDVLEIELQAIAPSLPVGFNAIRAGWGALSQQFTQPALRFIPLDLGNNVAEFPVHSGIKIPLKPFFGILGVATPENARISIPPGSYGGNIDNREIQAGSRLFLPVFVPGGLFSIGDGHAAQGDGEVNVTAIETSMNGRIKLTLRKDLQLTTPIAETPTDMITMGFASSLDTALELAVKNMIDLMEHFINLSAEDAYVLCSLAVNFRITQVVNSPQKGVHGMLPKSILSGQINL
ncbi:acetamidase/formamidase family protein [Umezakia ovalisporum]|jgi:acetamidase/formamidase|uniref:Acetamidase/formamidase family protein n=1 Tax=Umezakia ovalisporum FSS-43 TaxID=2740520 RepID=A0ABT6K7Z1_9CYAN|nr:acetamidase/formamidase family protein [Umezakia ovalisporum]MDH6058388.1 acetamidase/formamidase family protein [Umezakia ovalisporum FSS-43]MDH6067332.1 acetamidase/formamidase family protein [Umezakia ovalisporum APH033B]MDH6070558.1 acetamidase/formamidase family protein [Umezakia ovalisporum CobakiLakeA]MDH6075260.1 acetamidase/formamidase family protein [Umezakia ovalisporum CS-1034]MDH6077854.1 acetamidase/formamidase family protein [Umezakia ovalisporum FSS-45]